MASLVTELVVYFLWAMQWTIQLNTV